MSFNYQFNTKLNVSAAKPALIAITPHHSVEVISKQHVLLSHTEKQQALVLAHYLVNVIEVLKTFRTQAAHIKEIKDFMQLDNSATQDIDNVINQLKQNGFIISAPDTLAQAQHGSNYQPLQTPPVVVVRTAGRVSMLKRFLHSAQENEYRYNARYEYIIIDDSSPAQAEANAINIANSEMNIRHIDKTAQQALLDKFIQQFPEEQESIQFLLGEHPLHDLSPTYGRTWNWGTLLTAGKPVVFLDDDCLLDVYAPPIATDDTVSFGRNGQEVTFLSKAKPLNEQLEKLNIDPIAQLAQVLGMTPKQLACDANSFAEADCHIGEKLAKAHIVMTNPAVAGDPGSASPMWLYFLRDQAAKRFWGNNEADYQRHKSERYLWVGGTTPQLAFGGNYSVVARALDNRLLLPPTLPIFRNEDLLFTNLVHYLHPYGATLSTTWALGHQPEIERKWQDSDTQKGKDFDIGSAMDEFIDAPTTAPKGISSAETKLAQLSDELQQLFSADAASITRWQYRHQQAARASQVCALQNALEAAANHAPDYWQQDITAIIDANIQGNQALSFGDIDPAHAVAALQAFGQALPVWGKLWHVAQTRSTEMLP